MFERIESFVEVTLLQCLDEISASSIQRMIGFGLENGFELAEGGKTSAVFHDETAEGTAVSFLAEGTGVKGEMNIARSFIPCAEGASGDVLLDTFGGASEPRVFPIMNGTRAIGREMSDP